MIHCFKRDFSPRLGCKMNVLILPARVHFIGVHQNAVSGAALDDGLVDRCAAVLCAGRGASNEAVEAPGIAIQHGRHNEPRALRLSVERFDRSNRRSAVPLIAVPIRAIEVEHLITGTGLHVADELRQPLRDAGLVAVRHVEPFRDPFPRGLAAEARGYRSTDDQDEEELHQLCRTHSKLMVDTLYKVALIRPGMVYSFLQFFCCSSSTAILACNMTT